jgi:hypothetical protein
MEKRDNVKPFNVGRENVNEWSTDFDSVAKEVLMVEYGRKYADKIFERMKYTADEILKYIITDVSSNPMLALMVIRCSLGCLGRNYSLPLPSKRKIAALLRKREKRRRRS